MRLNHNQRSNEIAQASNTELAICDITLKACRQSNYDGHERVWLAQDQIRGLTAIIAMHDTSLGPAIGRTDMTPYATLDEALNLCLRQSRNMTSRAALAGLHNGGGHAIIVDHPCSSKDNVSHFLAFREMLETLRGSFTPYPNYFIDYKNEKRIQNHIGAELIRFDNAFQENTKLIAHDLEIGLRSAVTFLTGRDHLHGLNVAVKNLNQIGMDTCKRLYEHGAQLYVCDNNPKLVAKAIHQFDAIEVPYNNFWQLRVDSLISCDQEDRLDNDVIDSIKAKIILSASHDLLPAPHLHKRLFEKGVLCVPDFTIGISAMKNLAKHLPTKFNLTTTNQGTNLCEILFDIFVRAKKTNRCAHEAAIEMAEDQMCALWDKSPTGPFW